MSSDVMERAFINRYVVCVETFRPQVKVAQQTWYDYEAFSTRREAENNLKHLQELNKKNPNKKYYIVDQDKEPDHIFMVNTPSRTG